MIDRMLLYATFVVSLVLYPVTAEIRCPAAGNTTKGGYQQVKTTDEVIKTLAEASYESLNLNQPASCEDQEPEIIIDTACQQVTRTIEFIIEFRAQLPECNDGVEMHIEIKTSLPRGSSQAVLVDAAVGGTWLPINGVGKDPTALLSCPVTNDAAQSAGQGFTEVPPSDPTLDNFAKTSWTLISQVGNITKPSDRTCSLQSPTTGVISGCKEDLSNGTRYIMDYGVILDCNYVTTVSVNIFQPSAISTMMTINNYEVNSFYSTGAATPTTPTTPTAPVTTPAPPQQANGFECPASAFAPQLPGSDAPQNDNTISKYDAWVAASEAFNALIKDKKVEDPKSDECSFQYPNVELYTACPKTGDPKTTIINFGVTLDCGDSIKVAVETDSSDPTKVSKSHFSGWKPFQDVQPVECVGIEGNGPQSYAPLNADEASLAKIAAFIWNELVTGRQLGFYNPDDPMVYKCTTMDKAEFEIFDACSQVVEGGQNYIVNYNATVECGQSVIIKANVFRSSGASPLETQFFSVGDWEYPQRAPVSTLPPPTTPPPPTPPPTTRPPATPSTTPAPPVAISPVPELPVGPPTPPPGITTIRKFDQCGGKGGICANFVCADSKFPRTECTSGSVCTRQNQWYYQCAESLGSITGFKIPQEGIKPIAAAPAPAPAPGPGTNTTFGIQSADYPLQCPWATESPFGGVLKYIGVPFSYRGTLEAANSTFTTLLQEGALKSPSDNCSLDNVMLSVIGGCSQVIPGGSYIITTTVMAPECNQYTVIRANGIEEVDENQTETGNLFLNEYDVAPWMPLETTPLCDDSKDGYVGGNANDPRLYQLAINVVSKILDMSNSTSITIPAVNSGTNANSPLTVLPTYCQNYKHFFVKNITDFCFKKADNQANYLMRLNVTFPGCGVFAKMTTEFTVFRNGGDFTPPVINQTAVLVQSLLVPNASCPIASPSSSRAYTPALSTALPSQLTANAIWSSVIGSEEIIEPELEDKECGDVKDAQSEITNVCYSASASNVQYLLGMKVAVVCDVYANATVLLTFDVPFNSAEPFVVTSFNMGNWTASGGVFGDIEEDNEIPISDFWPSLVA